MDGVFFYHEQDEQHMLCESVGHHGLMSSAGVY